MTEKANGKTPKTYIAKSKSEQPSGMGKRPLNPQIKKAANTKKHAEVRALNKNTSGKALPKKACGKKYANKKEFFNFTRVYALFLLLIIVSALVFFLTPRKENSAAFDEPANGNSLQKKADKDFDKKADGNKKTQNSAAGKDGLAYKSRKSDAEPQKNIRKNKPAHQKNIPPKKSKTGKIMRRKPADKNLQALPAAKKGVLFFVFDDAGHNTVQLKRFLDLPFKCTIAVLPQLPKSAECAELTRRAGKEVILHQPMQAANPAINPGGGAVKKGMGAEEIKKIVRKNIEEIAPIAGMNNHEGSLITADELAMSAVLDVVLEKGIFFLDSRTSANSAAGKAAAAKNMSIFERSVFLDNEKDSEYMRAQINRGLKIAEKKGRAVMIGHVFTVELANILNEMYPELLKKGYEFSVLSEYY